MPSKIILLEDDDLVTQWVSEELEEQMGPDVDLTAISTESEFRNWIRGANRSLPYVFILDLRVRWTRPTPDMETPPQECADPTLAGIRCLQLIQDKQFSRQDIIFFSIHAGKEWRQKNQEAAALLDETGAVYLSKTEGLTPLRGSIESACRRHDL